ncbi:MAG: hypothetical protein ACRDJ1_00985 [Actinomycetota bacterium]
MPRRSLIVAGPLLAIWIVVAAGPAAAHLTDRAGTVEIEVGWASEPTFTGQPNAVVVILNEIRPRSNTEVPLEPGEATLSVEVIFGDKDGTQKMGAMPLASYQFGEEGELRSDSFIPSRPGAFTFHVTGTLRGRPFDRFYTSGERGAIEGTKFDDVRDVAAVSFPEKDPSNGQLELAIDTARKAAAASAKKASDDAATARTFAFVGIAFGLMGVGIALRPRGKKAAS